MKDGLSLSCDALAEGPKLLELRSGMGMNACPRHAIYVSTTITIEERNAWVLAMDNL